MSEHLSRRQFVQGSAAAAAAATLTAGLTPAKTVRAGNPTGQDTSKILNYNADMEYRRCGRTNLMISAAVLGGHWKRVDKMIGGEDVPGWMTMNISSPQYQLEVILTPYTASTKVVTDETGLWASIQKHDVGWFGIKPFASSSVFKGDSSPTSPHAEEDNRIARLAIRHILCNPAITAPMPGMISEQQVDNVALAVAERRELDVDERAELDRAMQRAWAHLPPGYQWLKRWEYV